jgi:dienelactone hydrolase
MSRTAEAFLSHGYVAASVVYFGAERTPPTLVEVPVEIGGQAVQAIARRNDVDPSRVAIMGSSKGGEYALLVASTYPEVKAVIAFVPAPFAWFGLGDHSMPTGCSWSRGGKALPCVTQDAAAGRTIWQKITTHEPVAFRASYDGSRADANAVKSAFFQLEAIQGPVLCLAGDDDQMWNSRAQCEMAVDYLREHRHPFPDIMVSYPNAGHLFMVAEEGPSAAMNRASAGSFVIEFGGTPEADTQAAQAAWRQIYAFLDKAFRH